MKPWLLWSSRMYTVDACIFQFLPWYLQILPHLTWLRSAEGQCIEYSIEFIGFSQEFHSRLQQTQLSLAVAIFVFKMWFKIIMCGFDIILISNKLIENRFTHVPYTEYYYVYWTIIFVGKCISPFRFDR